MKMFAGFSQHATLYSGVLLLCFNLTSFADEIQDANKLFKQGQQSQALDKVNTFLATKPKDAQARFLKGLILTEQGKTNDAIHIFSALTEDYPELPEPYNNLAVLYASQGLYDKARVALEMAIRTHPSYATAHENLGDIYAKMASQAYDRALQLDRSNTGTQTKLELIKELFTSGAKGGKGITAKPSAAAATTAAPQTPAAPSAVAAVSAPAPTKPAIAIAPTKQAAAEKPITGNSDEIQKTVHEWAAAWSAKSVKNYLSFYASDFKTPGGESREEWEATRRERITKPKTIYVGINNLKIKLTDDNHATATFRQSYRASNLKSSSSKTLRLVKSGGKWLIQEERAGE